MAKRQGFVTFDTSDVQGEDSWIKLRPMTLGEIMGIQQEAEAHDRFWHKVGAFLGRLFKRTPSATEQARRNMTQALQYVRDWNWADDKGDPLPLPSDDPSVLDRLIADEMRCITDCVNGGRQSEEQKN